MDRCHHMESYLSEKPREHLCWNIIESNVQISSITKKGNIFKHVVVSFFLQLWDGIELSHPMWENNGFQNDTFKESLNLFEVKQSNFLFIFLLFFDIGRIKLIIIKVRNVVSHCRQNIRYLSFFHIKKTFI